MPGLTKRTGRKCLRSSDKEQVQNPKMALFDAREMAAHPQRLDQHHKFHTFQNSYHSGHSVKHLPPKKPGTIKEKSRTSKSIFNRRTVVADNAPRARIRLLLMQFQKKFRKGVHLQAVPKYTQKETILPQIPWRLGALLRSNLINPDA